MRMTVREYLLTKIDTTIPRLSSIPALIQGGRFEEAEAVYAGFVRDSLKPQLYFRIPYYPPENIWKTPAETEEDVFRRLQNNEIMSVGYAHRFGPEGIQWEANPTPNHYTEWPWQLNRHHEFRMLGHLYRQTHDEAIAELFCRMFSSWREQSVCPDNVSGHDTVSWRTIEVGVRTTKIWHYALHAFYRSPAFTDHLLCEFFASMWENGWRLRNFRTHGNWLVMEMAGLYHIGLLYPWVKDAAEWKNYAIERLTDELHRQIYPDGFQYELSTNYHIVVASNYRYILDISRAMEEPLPDTLTRPLSALYDLYPRLCDPALRLPDINDGCKDDVSELLTEGRELFPDKPDYLYFASRRAQGTPPSFTDAVLPYSGMVVLRDHWGPDSQWAFFESAPFGRGHQHEDKLQFLLYAFGRYLLKDTGNFAYDTSDMRAYVLSARSHNTVFVDGQGQNRRSAYTWADEDINKLSGLEVRLGADMDLARGVYDQGFGPALIPVTHRRTVVKVKSHPLGLDTFYLVIDRLYSGDGAPHTYAARWQLESVPVTFERPTSHVETPASKVDYLTPLLRGARVTADYGDGVTLTLLSGENASMLCGSLTPFAGWRVPNVPAPAVDFTARGRDVRMVTLLYPSASGCPVRSISYYDPSPSANDVTIRTDSGEWTFTEAWPQ